MTITTRDQLISALGNNTSRIIIDKASLANQTAGRICSLWSATGSPAAGANPTTAALCNNTTTGGIAFTQQTDPATSYLAQLALNAANGAMSWEIHDRLAAMGGLSLNINTLQPPTGTNIELDTLAPSAARRGPSNYSEVQCWLEVYADGGATASNATINVTFDDDTTGNLNTLAVGGTIRRGNMFALNPLKTAPQQGKFIKRVNTVQLSAATGTAGNFGFTFTRPRAFAPTQVSNLTQAYDWALLGLPEVPNGSCLMILVNPSTTSSGLLRGGGKIIHG